MTGVGEPRRGILSFLTPLAIAGILLTGCAGATELSHETAARLQSGVVAVAESAAGGDPAGALGRLDEVQAELTAAREDGGVSEQRAADIQAAIDTVRADLQQAAEPEPAPVTPVEPAAPAGDDESEDENSGPGNNNGNGNGNGKDKDKGDD